MRLGAIEFERVEADGAVVEGVFVVFIGEDMRRRLGCRGALPCGAAEKRLQADEEDAEVEGLGEVVVGAGFDAFENVFRAGAGREHEDGGVELGFAEGTDDGEAVGAGKHAVEDDGGDVFAGIWQ